MAGGGGRGIITGLVHQGPKPTQIRAIPYRGSSLSQHEGQGQERKEAVPPHLSGLSSPFYFWGGTIVLSACKPPTRAVLRGSTNQPTVKPGNTNPKGEGIACRPCRQPPQPPRELLDGHLWWKVTHCVLSLTWPHLFLQTQEVKRDWPWRLTGGSYSFLKHRV